MIHLETLHRCRSVTTILFMGIFDERQGKVEQLLTQLGVLLVGAFSDKHGPSFIDPGTPSSAAR